MSNLAHQYQKYTDNGLGEPVGDCFRTAIACLLEIDRDEVPHFAQLHKDSASGLDWWHHAVRFVEDRLRGWTLICVRPIYPIYEAENCPDTVILSGDSPRGPWYHSILVSSRTGELAWDPHPEGHGVGFPADVMCLTEKKNNTYTATYDYNQEVIINGNN